MPWSGATFNRTDGTRTGPTVWQQNRTAGVKIVADGHDTHDQDIADGITDCLRKGGENSPTANLPMATFRHTGVGNATARDQYASAAQVQDGTLTYTTTIGGTGDVVTITLSVVPSNYVAGQVITWVVAAVNTGAVTVNINSLGAKALEKSQQALVAGDLAAGDTVVMAFDAVRDAFQLLSHQRTPVLTAASIDRASLAPNALVDIGAAPSTISNGTSPNTEIDIAAKTFLAQDTAAAIVLGATTIDISTVGNGGRLDSETRDPDTWYAVLAGTNTSDGAFVAGFKKTEAKPAAWDNFRRIGWVRTDGSSNLILFIQDGDDFWWTAPRNDNTAAIGATATLITLSAGPNTKARMSLTNVQTSNTETQTILTRTDQTDIAPSSTLCDLAFRSTGSQQRPTSIHRTITVDGSSQIRGRCNNALLQESNITTHGYIDRRGRDG